MTGLDTVPLPQHRASSTLRSGDSHGTYRVLGAGVDDLPAAPVYEKYVLRALGIARLKAGQNVVES